MMRRNPRTRRGRRSLIEVVLYVVVEGVEDRGDVVEEVVDGDGVVEEAFRRTLQEWFSRACEEVLRAFWHTKAMRCAGYVAWRRKAFTVGNMAFVGKIRQSTLPAHPGPFCLSLWGIVCFLSHSRR